MRLRPWMLAASTALVVTTVSAIGSWDDGEEKVDLSEVPAKVRKSAEKAAGRVGFTRAFKDEDGSYRLVGEGSGGGRVEVRATEEGDLLTLRKAVKLAPNKVPAPVVKAFRAEMGKNALLKGARPEKVEKVEERDAKKDTEASAYEYEVANTEKARHRIRIDEDGKVESVKPVPEEEAEPGEDGDAIDPDDLPEPVRKALAKEMPGVRFTRAEKETDEGDQTSYVVHGKDRGGRGVRVVSDPFGLIFQKAMEIRGPEVPEEVAGALGERVEMDPELAGFSPIRGEQVQVMGRQGGLEYRFLGKNADGRAFQLRVLPDGQVLVEPAPEGALDEPQPREKADREKSDDPKSDRAKKGSSKSGRPKKGSSKSGRTKPQS